MGAFFYALQIINSWPMMSIMKYSLILCLFFVSVIHAEIYRSVDENGNVTFTDAPDTKAERIELEELPTYTAPSVPTTPQAVAPETADEPAESLAEPIYTIAITSPEQNQSLWAGGGLIDVNATIKPELNQKRGDLVQFKLDGKKVGEPQSSGSYTLENVDRGSHILTASVVDKKGKTLKNSKSILFHIHRQSITQNNSQ